MGKQLTRLRRPSCSYHWLKNNMLMLAEGAFFKSRNPIITRKVVGWRSGWIPGLRDTRAQSGGANILALLSSSVDLLSARALYNSTPITHVYTYKSGPERKPHFYTSITYLRQHPSDRFHSAL